MIESHVFKVVVTIAAIAAAVVIAGRDERFPWMFHRADVDWCGGSPRWRATREWIGRRWTAIKSVVNGVFGRTDPEPLPDPDQCYSLDDVARLLRISRRSVERRIADGSLVATKIGGNVRVAKTDLLRAMWQMRTAVKPKTAAVAAPVPATAPRAAVNPIPGEQSHDDAWIERIVRRRPNQGVR